MAYRQHRNFYSVTIEHLMKFMASKVNRQYFFQFVCASHFFITYKSKIVHLIWDLDAF